MALSESDIQQHIDGGTLSISRPEGSINVEPSSIDLHLGDQLMKLSADQAVDVTDSATYPEAEETDDFTIPPRSFRLATTQEYVDLPDGLVGFLWGRSSVGRLGLFVHNAGLVDSGFSGDLTLELFNAAEYPIELEAGMRIVQLTLHEHDNPPELSYDPSRGSKYQGQQGITPSRLSEDFE